jgi:hypothetical protein
MIFNCFISFSPSNKPRAAIHHNSKSGKRNWVTMNPLIFGYDRYNRLM